MTTTTPTPTPTGSGRRAEGAAGAIEAHGLAKTYPGGVEAVTGVDFAVGRGEVFGLLGPNGAGKSTTIGMLTTTIVPTAGRALVGGFDVAAAPRSARAVSAVVFQEPVVDNPLTGRRNLLVHARLWGLDARAARARVDDVVDAFGLGPVVDRPVATYSGGQRRRLEIARALVSEPRVLFLDEPTVGLDPRIRLEILDLVAGLRARLGMTVLLTTHYLDEAEQLCDRVAIVHQGRIVALDSPAALLAGLGREMLEVRVDGAVPPVLSALQAHAIAGTDAFTVGGGIHVPLHGRSSREAVEAIADAGIVARAITARPPTLDDVYLRFTGVSIAG
jgi:ABC-2 type transport system ATP-binding protein